jgi:hypothetical protein
MLPPFGNPSGINDQGQPLRVRAIVPKYPTPVSTGMWTTAPGALHTVENIWTKIKEWGAVATRYDKTATSFDGCLYLAAAFQWLS